MNETGVTEDYKATIKDLREELRKKDDRINELREHILSLETEQPLNSKKRKKLSSVGEMEMSEEIIKEMYDKDLKIQKLEQKNEELRAAFHIQDGGEVNTKNKQDETSDIIKLIEEKLSSGLESIQTNVIKLIDDRMSDKGPENTQTRQTTTVSKQTYASAAGKNNVSGNLRTIIMATKNEERTEEADRNRRATNLIVYGVNESNVDSEEEDVKFAKGLVKDLQIGIVDIKSVERIGHQTTNLQKIRPLKLVFKTVDEQQKVLNNLRNLRGNDEYKKVSIKEDYTVNERDLIKEYVNQAKAQNAIEEANNTNIVWKVRGSPKNGLILKRFIKEREETQAWN